MSSYFNRNDLIGCLCWLADALFWLFLGAVGGFLYASTIGARIWVSG